MKGLKNIISHIPSEDMWKTVNFISKTLGFEVTFQSDFYTELQVEDKIIGVLSSVGKPNQQSIYLQVRDVDELWRELGSELMKIKAKPPFNQPHGMREVHLIIPASNTLLMIGSTLG